MLMRVGGSTAYNRLQSCHQPVILGQVDLRVSQTEARALHPCQPEPDSSVSIKSAASRHRARRVTEIFLLP